MGATNQRTHDPRGTSFEPQPLHIPVPQLKEQVERKRKGDEKKPGTHVVVIDIS